MRVRGHDAIGMAAQPSDEGDANQLDPERIESIVFTVAPDGTRTLASAMYILGFDQTMADAPDIAGEGVANPLATFLSVAMLLRHGLARETEAAAVESAVDAALAAGLRTRDLGGEAGTAEATDAVLSHLERTDS